MAKDFRQFLEQLERDSPHEVIRIKKPVDPAAFELTALLVHLERQGKFPVLLLERAPEDKTMASGPWARRL
jgi:3-polyprenyl-4-hydroxybenzoate decarboxylase